MQKLVDKSQFNPVKRDPQIERLLPELVKRLIRNAAGPGGYERLRIPDGEGYRDKGLDGQVFLHDSTDPLPAGEIRLEIGATADLTSFKAKAENEYRRVLDLLGDDAATTTFVMIGRVPWDGVIKKDDGSKAEWRLHIAQTLKGEDKVPFKNCVLIDQSRLIDWVNSDIETAVWLLQELGHIGMRSPPGILGLQRRIEIYQGRFAIGVNPKILTVEQNLEGLVENLDAGQPTVVFGNSSSEACVAACQYLLESHAIDDRPAVVVTREAGVEILKAVTTPHVVILQDEAAMHANRLARHHTIIARPLLRSSAPPGNIILRRPTVEAFARHLDVTKTAADAETISRAVGRTMTALERGYGTDVAKANAPWASPDDPDHDLVCKLTILGGWNRGKIHDRGAGKRRMRHRDLELIHELCGLGPVGKDGTIERIIKKYGREEGKGSGATDPLFASGPEVVNLNAPVDAFYRLAELFTNEHFQILREALRRVLQYKAKNPPDRNAIFDPADHYGYSPTLTGGLILSFVLIGIFGHQAPLNLRPDEQSSARWCEELYFDAMPSISEHPQFVDSIQQYLPLLAEGLTHPFLRSLEMLLEGNAETVGSIFQSRESTLGIHRYHFGNALLWAIERVGWIGTNLSRCARILMGLHIASGEIDTQIGNQPLTSLRGLLSLGIPQTEAPLEDRLKAYSMLADTFGVRTLDLFTSLLDTSGGFQKSHTRPIFTQVDPLVLTYGDYYAARDHVASLVVNLVAESPDHAIEVIDTVPAMVDPVFDHFVDVLRAVEPNSVLAVSLAESLRNFVGHHSEFPDADWSLPESRLAPLRETQAMLVDDPLLASRWLFESDWVRLYDGDRTDSHKRLEALRLKAVEPLLNLSADEAIRFADAVGAPSTVGFAVGQVVPKNPDIVPFVKSSIRNLAEDKRASFLRGLSRGRGLESPETWLSYLEDSPFNGEDDVLRCFGEGLPSTSAMIETVASHTALPATLRNGFWSWMNIHALHHFAPSEATVTALFNAGRAHDLAALVGEDKSNLSNETIAKIFDEFLSHLSEATKAGRNSDMSLYYYWKLVEVVEDRKIRTLRQIAYHQFPLSRTLRFNGPKRPAALHRLMAQNPEEFMEVVRLAYRADGPEDDELAEPSTEIGVLEPEVEPHVSEAAWHALDSLSLLPGWADGKLDADRMQSWIGEAQRLAETHHRKVASDIAIGSLLGKSPVDPKDQLWPHKAVRLVIENGLPSRAIRHIQIGESNNRGVYSVSSLVHHASMAEKFENFASQMDEFPRTQAMLLAIAGSEKRWAENAEEEERDQSAAHGIN